MKYCLGLSVLLLGIICGLSYVTNKGDIREKIENKSVSQQLKETACDLLSAKCQDEIQNSIICSKFNTACVSILKSNYLKKSAKIVGCNLIHYKCTGLILNKTLCNEIKDSCNRIFEKATTE